jgi:hypothetical protein
MMINDWLCHYRMACRIGVLALAAAILAGILGCRAEQESESEMPQREIVAVMEDHVDALMALPDVVGVAIGALDNGTPCLMILVIEESDDVKREIPAEIEGHPVKIVVSGEIKPLDSN